MKTIQIRPETPQDYPAIAILNQAAFGQPNEAQLIEKIRHSAFYIPDLALVAEWQGQIIGYLMFSYINLVSEKTYPILALAPIAVQPEFQNQGVGCQLMEQGLKLADERGERLILVLGHTGFYTKFGFEPSIQWNIESPFPVQPEYFMIKPLKNYQPEHHGQVVYPDHFLEV